MLVKTGYLKPYHAHDFLGLKRGKSLSLREKSITFSSQSVNHLCNQDALRSNLEYLLKNVREIKIEIKTVRQK